MHVLIPILDDKTETQGKTNVRARSRRTAEMGLNPDLMSDFKVHILCFYTSLEQKPLRHPHPCGLGQHSGRTEVERPLLLLTGPFPWWNVSLGRGPGLGGRELVLILALVPAPLCESGRPLHLPGLSFLSHK